MPTQHVRSSKRSLHGSRRRDERAGWPVGRLVSYIRLPGSDVDQSRKSPDPGRTITDERGSVDMRSTVPRERLRDLMRGV